MRPGALASTLHSEPRKEIHMRKLLLIATTLVVASAVATAQRHVNYYEVPVKGTLSVTGDVWLGTSLLKEGTYNYKCDREHITFANPNSGKTVLKVPCQGRELRDPVDVTTMVVQKDAAGRRVVTRLLLKGSNIEHVFQ
jgi:hypothetical protein